MTSAVRELVAARELFLVLVVRKLKITLKRAFMGAVWPVIAPFFLTALYVFVFSRVFEAPMPRYPEFLTAAILPWTFLSTSLGSGIGSITGEPGIVRKAPFPYEMLPLSSTAAQAFNFVITLSLFVLYLAVVGRLHAAVLPVILVAIGAVVLLAMGLSMVLSLIDVYNHDLRQVLGNLLTIWFFLLPIVYPPDWVPDSLSFLRVVDPMNVVVGVFRDILYFGRLPEMMALAGAFLMCAAVFVVCLALFRRFSRNLAKDV
jgi:ABC-type polysaccharide/polyol phosphate export permease